MINFKLLFLAVALFAAGCAVPANPAVQAPTDVDDPKVDLVDQIKDNPSDLQAHADLLRMQIRDGDEVGARATVEHAVDKNPTDPRARLLSAQYSRWQLDLISAENELKKALDLDPARLEARIALAGLYHQTWLEDLELQQRQTCIDLSSGRDRSEFLLDYAFAAAQLGRDQEALATVQKLLADDTLPVASVSRLRLLQSELALRAGDQKACVAHAIDAFKLQPNELGALQYAARLEGALAGETGLNEIFDQVLANQDREEPRWTALYAKWLATVKAHVARGQSPAEGEAEALWMRLGRIQAAQPDALTRRAQLLGGIPERAAEAANARKMLAEAGFGAPATLDSAAHVVTLWHAEDALRLGDAKGCLRAVKTLTDANQAPDTLRMLRIMALFRDRQDDLVVQEIDALLEAADEPDDILTSMKRWVALRNDRAKALLDEFKETPPEGPNELWLDAVARFRTYRNHE